MEKGKIFNFRHFWWPSWIFVENEKGVNISKTVRDRAISREFLTRRVVQQCCMQREKLQEYLMQRGKNFHFHHFWRPS